VDKLADNSVTAAKIVDGEVGTNELADDNITENKLAPPLKNKLQDLKEMQYRHNLNLHTFGVAGDGLVVRFANDQTNTPWTPDLTSVELRVSPGIAIDNTGREILQPDPVSYILTIPQTTSSIRTFLTIRWDEATQSPIFQDIVSPPQDGSVIILAQVYGYQGEGFFVGDYLRQVASARVSLVKQKVSIEVQGEGLQQALNTNSNSNSQASYTQSNGIINSANASSGQSSAYSSGLSNSVSASANQSSATTYGIYNSSSASGQSSAYSQGLTSYSYASSSQQNAYTTSYGIYASSSAYSPQANPNAASYGIYAESSGTNAKIYGIYTRAYNNGIPLYVEGKAVITGGVSSGHITDRFINRSGQRLRTGDVVKLKGTPIARFSGENNRIPLPEVILCDQENDSKVIGIVDSEAIPGPEVPDTRIGADDPTFIEDGGDLYVVILGTYAHCKVDATEAPIEVGDLLTSSNNPGHAKKATDPKLGTIIGKALEPLEKGTGYIAVFVNIQ
jgi:hypothetical protein